MSESQIYHIDVMCNFILCLVLWNDFMFHAIKMDFSAVTQCISVVRSKAICIIGWILKLRSIKTARVHKTTAGCAVFQINYLFIIKNDSFFFGMTTMIGMHLFVRLFDWFCCGNSSNKRKRGEPTEKRQSSSSFYSLSTMSVTFCCFKVKKGKRCTQLYFIFHFIFFLFWLSLRWSMDYGGFRFLFVCRFRVFHRSFAVGFVFFTDK